MLVSVMIAGTVYGQQSQKRSFPTITITTISASGPVTNRRVMCGEQAPSPAVVCTKSCCARKCASPTAVIERFQVVRPVVYSVETPQPIVVQYTGHGSAAQHAQISLLKAKP